MHVTELFVIHCSHTGSTLWSASISLADHFCKTKDISNEQVFKKSSRNAENQQGH